MSKPLEFLALTALIAATCGLCGRLTGAPLPADRTLVEDFSLITAAMSQHGLKRRVDVIIEINESAAAAGFSRPGCDGLLLVAPLPQTAQSLDRIAPALDFDSYIVNYAYDGNWHDEVPRLSRLGDRLRADFRPSPVNNMQRLVGVAEAGNCNLLANVEDVVLGLSLGKVDALLAVTQH